MGLVEIIISTIAFIIMWFIVFTIILKYENKKLLDNIGRKLEAQDERTFNIFGKRVKAGEVVDEEGENLNLKPVETLEENPEQIEIIEDVKPKPKKKVVKKTAKKTTKKVSKKKK